MREFPTSTGEVDYALFIDGTPMGVVEAKRREKGENLTTVELQSARYANYNGNSINKKVKQEKYMLDVLGWNYIST